VYHRSAAGLGDHPLAAGPFRKIDGFLRAEPEANPAAFAENRIDGKSHLARGFTVFTDRLEPALPLTNPAPLALFLAYHGLMAAAELMAFFEPGRKDQVQIRRIHVAVGYDRTVGQDGQGRGNTGLAGAALSADDDKFCDTYLPPFMIFSNTGNQPWEINVIYCY
jgi:hypothetical protein